MVQQKKELSLGRVSKDIQPLSLSPRYYGHIGQNTELCPLTATVSGFVWRSVASGRSRLRMARMAAPPLWPFRFWVAMSPTSSLLAPRESSSIN